MIIQISSHLMVEIRRRHSYSLGSSRDSLQLVSQSDRSLSVHVGPNSEVWSTSYWGPIHCADSWKIYSPAIRAVAAPPPRCRRRRVVCNVPGTTATVALQISLLPRVLWIVRGSSSNNKQSLAGNGKTFTFHESTADQFIRSIRRRRSPTQVAGRFVSGNLSGVLKIGRIKIKVNNNGKVTCDLLWETYRVRRMYNVSIRNILWFSAT